MDASTVAIVRILLQLETYRATPEKRLQRQDQSHSVAFWSKKLNDAKRNYNTPQSKLLAIVDAIKHWRYYLKGAMHPITILTDHSNLQRFMTKRDLRGQEAQWAQELAHYDFQIVYRPGKLNPADGPSRWVDYGIEKNPKADQKRLKEATTLDQGFQAYAILAMVTRLQTQGGDPDHIPVLNSNQESEEILWRAERTRDAMA